MGYFVVKPAAYGSPLAELQAASLVRRHDPVLLVHHDAQFGLSVEEGRAFG
ncbi:MAG: hypothetical protein WBP72_10035 [Rhodocyclaceae bacterium]